MCQFLGITIDEKLTWSKHVKNMSNKILMNKRLLATAQNLLPSYVLKNIYYAHIYSHLTYGLVVWGSMITKKEQNMIYKIQKDCIRILSNKKETHTTAPLYKQNSMLNYLLLIW